MLMFLHISFVGNNLSIVEIQMYTSLPLNCCLWRKMSSLLLLLLKTLLYPYIEFFEFCTGTETCVSTYTSTLLYMVAGASTSSHGELYSPSTTLQRKEWFSQAVQMKVHISTVVQGILTVLFAVCLYPTVLGLFGMSFSACTTLQTKISLSNRFTKLINK